MGSGNLQLVLLWAAVQGMMVLEGSGKNGKEKDQPAV